MLIRVNLRLSAAYFLECFVGDPGEIRVGVERCNLSRGRGGRIADQAERACRFATHVRRKLLIAESGD